LYQFDQRDRRHTNFKLVISYLNTTIHKTYVKMLQQHT